MEVIVDRFEGGFAVVELPDRTMIPVDKRLLPDAKEGDVVEIKINPEKTEERRNKIKKLAEDLWE